MNIEFYMNTLFFPGFSLPKFPLENSNFLGIFSPNFPFQLASLIFPFYLCKATGTGKNTFTKYITYICYIRNHFVKSIATSVARTTSHISIVYYVVGAERLA